MVWPNYARRSIVYGSCMKLIIISEKLFWYVTPPWNNIAKVAVMTKIYQDRQRHIRTRWRSLHLLTRQNASIRMPPTSIAETCAGHSTPSADARIDARDKHTASTLHIARCSSRYSKEGTTQHPSTSINIIFVCSVDPSGLESRGVERCFPSSCSNPDCAKTCKWGMALDGTSNGWSLKLLCFHCYNLRGKRPVRF